MRKETYKDHNGNPISVINKASNVLMDNGETLERAISKVDTFTPSITQESLMSKVGQGVDVDYHKSVKEGVYEECIFEGKTLVNVASRVIDKPANSTTDNVTFTLTTFVEKWQSVVYHNALLKPNTTYTVFLNVIQNEGSLESPLKIQLGHGSIGFRNIKRGFTGRFVAVITTANDISETLSLALRSSPVAGEVVKVSDFVVLEGDYSHLDVPHFTGLTNVVMPSLQNIGKNLFDGDIELGGFTSYGDNIEDNTKKRSKHHMRLKPNTTYCIGKNNLAQNTNILFYDKNKKYLSRTVSMSFTTPDNCYYAHLYWNATTILDKDVIQVEESSALTSYEPYRINTVKPSTEILLRGVGSAKDTYNALTGEYIKNVHEITLNGTEQWSMNTVSDWSSLDSVGFILYLNNTQFPPFKFPEWTKDKYICDKYQTSIRSSSTLQAVTNVVTLGGVNSSGTGSMYIGFKVPASKFANVEAFKAQLASSPVTIQYEIATPVTSFIEPIGIPFAYENGHVVLTSTRSIPSLTPPAKYKVITSRTGQINSTSQLLIKQEKQIASIEDRLALSIVNLKYNNIVEQYQLSLARDLLK